jgi:hypothetical protein
MPTEAEQTSVTPIPTHSRDTPPHLDSDSAFAHHSVPISDSNIDNTMTLCRLRHPSGCPPDYT